MDLEHQRRKKQRQMDLDLIEEEGQPASKKIAMVTPTKVKPPASVLYSVQEQTYFVELQRQQQDLENLLRNNASKLTSEERKWVKE